MSQQRRVTGLHAPEQVEKFTQAGLWGVSPWPALLGDHCQLRPGSLAVVDPPNLVQINGCEPQRLTWAELNAQVDRLAARFVGQGIGQGDVVGIQLPNSVDLVVTYLALSGIGAVSTPFPVQYREFELVQMAELAQMKAFVTVDEILGRSRGSVTEALATVHGVDAIFCFGSNPPRGAVALASGPAAELSASERQVLDGYRAAVDLDPNDAVTICWTSGTESTPKGIPRCPNDWYPMALSSVDAMELTVDDVLLNPFPMVNMAGIAGMFLPWLLTGAVLVLHHPFDPEIFFRQISEEKVTYTVAAPAVLIRALDMPGCTPEALQSVRVIGSGSAPLPPSMIVAWRERFGIDIVNCFGSNEGVNMVSDARTVPDPELRSVLFPRFGSNEHVWDNRASFGIQSRLVDPVDHKLITEAGIPGELRLKGPGIFSGYLEGTSNANAFDAEGYFCTGDLFQYVADADGDLRFLQYVDRAKDLIVRGGMNISPAEIESLLAMHPKVLEAAVVGVPDPTMGERSRAVVVLREGESLDLAELVEFLRGQRIANFKLPEELVILDSLPRNPVGKILKRELRSVPTTTTGKIS